MKQFKVKKKGLSLLEVFLAIGIVLGLSTIKTLELKQEADNILGDNVAAQMKTIAGATNAFINLNYEDLIGLKSDQAKGIACDTGTKICTITMKSLANNMLLPNNFTQRTLLNSNYNIKLKREGVAPNYMINGIVYMDQPVQKYSDRSDAVLSGMIIKKAGIDAGISNNGNMQGLGGSWNTKLADFSIPNKNGLIGMNVGYTANMYSVYLRRDGTLPMTGDLNLDTHNINNISNLNITGTLTTANLKSKTGNIDNINSKNIINKDKFQSTGTNVLEGQTTVNGEYLKVDTTNSTFNKAVVLKDTLEVGKTATFNGSSKFNGTIVATGTTANLGNVNVKDNLNVKGKTTIDNEVEIGSPTGLNVNIKNGNILAKGNVQANLLVPQNVAVINTVCSIKGAIAQDSKGGILSCQSGRWTMPKGTIEFFVKFDRRCSTPNKITGACSCSAGTNPVLIGEVNDGCTSTGANGSCNSKYYTSYFCS